MEALPLTLSDRFFELAEMHEQKENWMLAKLYLQRAIAAEREGR